MTLPFRILPGFRGNGRSPTSSSTWAIKAYKANALSFPSLNRGGGLDSSGGVTKNVIRDQLLEVPNLTRTYPKIRRQQTSIFRATLPNDFVSSDETPQLPFPDYFESFLEQVWILLSRIIIFASMYL